MPQSTTPPKVPTPTPKKEATDEEISQLVADELLIRAIKRNQAKRLASQDNPSRK